MTKQAAAVGEEGERAAAAAAANALEYLGWSKPGKVPNINPNRAFFHQILMKDYFDERPTYHANFFRRRFLMRHELFLRIQGDLIEAHGDIFMQKRDALGKLGFSPEQKITSALRLLAYSSCADLINKYIRMGE